MTGEFDGAGGGGVSGSIEAAFESHIGDWLVEHGGYEAVKVGNAGDDAA